MTFFVGNLTKKESTAMKNELNGSMGIIRIIPSSEKAIMNYGFIVLFISVALFAFSIADSRLRDR